MDKIKFTLLIIVLVVATTANGKRPKVVDYIEQNSRVQVKQSKKIDRLLEKYIKGDDKPYVGVGYRVQVYSSNQQKKAKTESDEVASNVRSAFPSTGVYRTFSSPFWKVRVGNFKTREDAEAFRKIIISRLPKLRSKSYVVRSSRVAVSGK